MARTPEQLAKDFGGVVLAAIDDMQEVIERGLSDGATKEERRFAMDGYKQLRGVVELARKQIPAEFALLKKSETKRKTK
jgi:hypothetical protein